MLYITTRNKNDAFTAYRTLGQNRGPDGGQFVPFQMPMLNRQQIVDLRDKSFGQCVADILNLFFSARMDGWDVDFSVGRYPTRLVAMSHRIIVAEPWHNPDLDFARIVRNLASRIRGTEDTADLPTSWAWIATRIATLFGVFGELERLGVADPEHPVDVAVTTGDFSPVMAVWYAREMGLPIATIICSCNENAAVWDLIHHGELHTDAVAVHTTTPEADIALPEHIERLVYEVLGYEENQRFLEVCRRGGTYLPREADFEALRQGLFAAVVSQNRMESIIRNVYSTSTYLLDPYSALGYGGLLDYRASTGETRPAILMTERSPLCEAGTVAKAMGITVQELKDRIS